MIYGDYVPKVYIEKPGINWWVYKEKDTYKLMANDYPMATFFDKESAEKFAFSFDIIIEEEK